MLAQLATLAMKYGPRNTVAPFTPVQLRQRSPAFGFVIDVGQRV